MSPTPSESVLILRILDALSDSGKTALGISNYIKAKFYRVETSHEITIVIRKYLLDEKVMFEPFYGVYRLKYKLNSKKKEKVASKKRDKFDFKNKGNFPKVEIKSPAELNYPEIQIPQNVSFLNELYKSRERLMLLPVQERLTTRKLEIIEIIAEIEGIKPLAISELSQLDYNIRAIVIRELVPSLKTELRKVVFEEGKNQNSKIESEELEEDYDTKIEFVDVEEEIVDIQTTVKFENEIFEKKEFQETVIENEQLSEGAETNVNFDMEFIPVESVIKLIIEEKIRLGKLDGNLLAENIMFRIKKGKWD